MANMTLASSLLLPSLLPNSLPSGHPYPLFYSPTKRRSKSFKVHAQLGGGDGNTKGAGKKKFITREQEPEQYWRAAGEGKGENPMKTPLPYIILFGMSTPFVILALGFANGWIKVPIR